MPMPCATPLEQLRLVADRMCDWQFHCWYWGDAIAVDGLLERAADAAEEWERVAEALVEWCG